MSARAKSIDPDRMVHHAGDAAALLKALSHPMRLMILCHLMDGEACVSSINQQVPLSQSALSQHLAVLRRCRLVTTRRDGQQVFYRVDHAATSQILEVLFEHYCTRRR